MPLLLGSLRGKFVLLMAMAYIVSLEPEAIDDSIRKADLAIYCAKAQGRDQLVVYTPKLGETRVVL